MDTTQIRPSENGVTTHAPPSPPPRLRRTSRRPRTLWLALILVSVIICGAAAFFIVRTRLNAAPSLQTQPVVQGTLVQTVTASGTVNPQNTVSVGSQVSGTLSEVDVDYNSRVQVGEVLAKIDPSTFQAAVDQAQAQLAQAQGQYEADEATIDAQQATYQSNAAQVAKAQSALTLANQTVARDKALIAHGYIAQSQLDTDLSAQVAAQAAVSGAIETAQSSNEQVKSAESTAAGAQANVQSVEASLQTAELNLQHTVITSPVNGIVIARDVSVGETVASSLQTPTLFSIAQDLSKMEVDLSVGEPDIGNIHAGDFISFSVLAYPNRTYTGTVTQVRENPTTVNNVVTYTVVTDVANKDNSLLPGMTANATVNVAKVQNALIVPLQALQYRPSGFAGHTHHTGTRTGATPLAAGATVANTTSGASTASPWGATLGGSSGALVAGGDGVIFVDQAGHPKPVRVQIGLVQGTQAAVTPIKNGALQAGDQVILAQGGATAATHTVAASPLGGTGGLGRGFH
ncbi:MAG TPA: efflux RND transporter periplasmic adaptor subunit [Candidatus Acidoferrales bacterium]|nr:efflux RND transporter periplasmic adaptor subunit [Candidatus Acidoferrales bacterium]